MIRSLNNRSKDSTAAQIWLISKAAKKLAQKEKFAQIGATSSRQFYDRNPNSSRGPFPGILGG
jgi:hypothetical protein